MTATRHYQAFISYSHSDENWARWLQRALEKYRLPKTLRQSHPHLPTRLYPIFRDRDELASGVDLSESIRKAMDDSAALIVVCSPTARTSRWVNEEIRRFQASGRSNRIFCLLVEGSPDPHAQDCAFPSALLQDEHGQTLREPLAADVSPSGDGKRNAMLKIAAGLLDVGVDDLKRRDAQRQARFWSIVAFGALFIAALTIGLAIYAFKAKKESELRRQQAEGLIGFMLGDLREKLEPIGKLDILDAVGDQAMKYFATLGDQGSTKEMLERGKALRQIGDVRFNQGELEPALQAFKQALAQTEALHKAEPANNDYLFELGQAEFWVGYVAWERGQLDQAFASMQRYMQYSEKLSKRASDNDDYRLEVSYALGNLGSIAHAQGHYELALEKFKAAADVGEQVLSKDSVNIAKVINLTETRSWTGTTLFDFGKIAESRHAFQKALDTIRPFHVQDVDRRASDTYARQLALKANADASNGDIDSAKKLSREAADIYARLLQLDASNSTWRFGLHKAEYITLSLLTKTELDTKTHGQIDLLVSNYEKLASATPDNTDYLMGLALAQRLQTLTQLATGRSENGLQLAEQAWLNWNSRMKAKKLTAELAVTEAMLEETLGVALAANGQYEKARMHWQNRTRIIDASPSSTHSLPKRALRRLLAIDLNQAQIKADIETQLTKAGFKDPRLDTPQSLSGYFQQPAANTPTPKEH